ALPRAGRAPLLQRALGRRDRRGDRAPVIHRRGAAPSRTHAAQGGAWGYAMTEPRDDLIDETYLRRALRLENDERAPRFDARGIAALAAQAPRTRLAVSLGATAAALTVLVAFAVWSLLIAEVPAFVDAASTALLDGVVAVATVLVPIAQAASDPV